MTATRQKYSDISDFIEDTGRWVPLKALGKIKSTTWNMVVGKMKNLRAKLGGMATQTEMAWHGMAWISWRQ